MLQLRCVHTDDPQAEMPRTVQFSVTLMQHLVLVGTLDRAARRAVLPTLTCYSSTCRYTTRARVPRVLRDVHRREHAHGLRLRAVANTLADFDHARQHRSPWMLTDVVRDFCILLRSFVVKDISGAGGNFVRTEGAPARRTQYLRSKHSVSRHFLNSTTSSRVKVFVLRSYRLAGTSPVRLSCYWSRSAL